MQRRPVEVPPVRFWVTRRGAGTAIVLIHGLSGSEAWWSRNVETLARMHEVVSLDLVGFGRNRPLTGGELPLPFDDAASVIGRWLSQTFPAGVHLVGHSMGGQISLLIAAAYPDVVRSLTLVGSTGLPIRPDITARIRNLLRTPRRSIGFAPVVARDFLRAGPTSVAVAAARLLFTDAVEAMLAVTAPTLLLWGARDSLVPERYALRMLDLIPGSRLETISNATHVPMWENAKEFNDRLLAFVAEVDEEAAPPTLPAPRRARYFQWGIDDVVDGVAWRSSGKCPDLMLVHGLGIPSAYFQPLARALYRHDVIAVAADQPGVGWSRGDLRSFESSAQAVISVAEQFDVSPGTWVGHSTGCSIVERVRQLRPDLVKRAIYLSPVWSDRPHLLLRLLTSAAGDAMREHPRLVAFAIASYFRNGLFRMARVLPRWAHDAGEPRTLHEDDLIVAGEEDPLVDWDYLRGLGKVIAVPGAHGMHFLHPEAVAAVIEEKVRSRHP